MLTNGSFFGNKLLAAIYCSSVLKVEQLQYDLSSFIIEMEIKNSKWMEKMMDTNKHIPTVVWDYESLMLLLGSKYGHSFEESH